MKIKAIVFTFIFIVFITEIYSQNSGWTWINRLPQGNDLLSSSISSSNTAFITGEWGALLKTTDNGLNWVNQYTLPFKDYTCIYFVNSNTGFAGAIMDQPYLHKTTNSGVTWTGLNTGLPNNQYITSIYFFNANTGLATVSNNIIIRTTDGGNSWVNAPSVINSTVNELIGFNPSVALFARTYSRLYKSFSMGDNWLELTLPDSLFSIRDMFFLDENTGMLLCYFMNGSQRIVKTTNGGYAWFTNNIISSSSVLSIYFFNEYTGFGAGGSYNNNSIVVKTTNGGINWSEYNLYQSYVLNDIKFFNQNSGYAEGTYGTLITTTNGGLNWNSRSSGFIRTITDVDFINEQTGYLTTFPDKHVLKTENGGISWDTMFTASQQINKIKFVNNNTGYIAGGDHISYSNGIICKTTNEGINWIVQSNSPYSIYAMYFIDENNGYAAGRPEQVLKTTNGGINWIPYQAGTYSFINSIYFFDVNTGYCGGGMGKLFKTNNGGLNWTYDSLGDGGIKSVRFANSQTGFITSSNNPYLYKTTNRGSNWSPIPLSYLNSFVDEIFFSDANTGFILANYRLIRTTDCGATWDYQETVTNELGSIDFINNNTGFLAGSYGKLLKTSNGGGNFVGIIKQNTETIPEHFSLSQNYPNPFNPLTTIKFDVPLTPLNPPFSQRGEEQSGGGFVKLTIYDILGKEITTLVNEQLQPGSYSVTWDASNYPSGVYFYKITSGDYSESKKMLLIK